MYLAIFWLMYYEGWCFHSKSWEQERQRGSQTSSPSLWASSAYLQILWLKTKVYLWFFFLIASRKRCVVIHLSKILHLSSDTLTSLFSLLSKSVLPWMSLVGLSRSPQCPELFKTFPFHWHFDFGNSQKTHGATEKGGWRHTIMFLKACPSTGWPWAAALDAFIF